MTTDRLSAVILAGTHHWSGSSFESLEHRPLIPVALAPLLTYPLRWVRQGGVRHATICANGAQQAIEAALAQGGHLEMELGYYQDGTPRGAAGCVRDAGLRTRSQTLVVADGTVIPTVDLAELLAAHRSSGAAVTAVVHRPRCPSAPPMPGGVYLFERHVLDYIAENGFQDIKESLIPKLHRAGERVVAHVSGGACAQVVNAQTYLAVNEWMLERLAHAGEGAILVHPTAHLEPGARLVGPVQLGAGVRVEAGATIVGPTSIGPESRVGRNALVARSAVWSRCTVGEASVVHGGVLGNDEVVAPAARLFNVVGVPLDIPPASVAHSQRGQRAPEAHADPVFRRQLPGSVRTSYTIG
jgi:NDP-sugar pyrophosphorylase family protein